MAGDTGPTRVRRDVQSLIDGGAEGKAVLDAYAMAIQKMRDLDAGEGGLPPSNPLSWRFQAAIHGIDATGDPLWNTCEHFSWFFLPWHRIYLLRFERIIQRHLGDDTWSLPYWDYTKGTENSRRLPLAFREPTTDNPLFTDRRAANINGGEPIGSGLTTAKKALESFPFALDVEDARSTFGGGMIRTFQKSKQTRGSLEGTPHGNIHTSVGGDASGWMFRFKTAGLDPIFWLHHCNLDRLWDVWRGCGGTNPDDTDWLDTKYEFIDVDGGRVTSTIRSVLDTAALGYRYESTQPPAGVNCPHPERIRLVEDAEMPSPELVGATHDVPLARPETRAMGLEPRRRPFERELAEERWHLRVENVAGNDPQAVAYAVHLNVEGERAAEEPGLRVGMVSAFGIIEASQADERHDGTGVTDVFDITDAVRELAGRGAWDEKHAKVTIVPIGSAEEPVPGGDVRAGRISIYRG